MKLYGQPPTRTLRVMWLLNELELECEMISVDLRKGEHLTEEFLALNPAGKVPVLVDGSSVVTESAAIQLYLAEKHPEAGLIPTRLEERAQMHRWMFFLVTEIEQPLWRIARHTFIYPDEIRSEQEILTAGKECRQMLKVLEDHMEGREFLVGDRLSVADFNAAYTLDWARGADMLSECPRLQQFLDRMYSRPTAPPSIAETLQ